MEVATVFAFGFADGLAAALDDCFCRAVDEKSADFLVLRLKSSRRRGSESGLALDRQRRLSGPRRIFLRGSGEYENTYEWV